jgi:hypothetical protein
MALSKAQIAKLYKGGRASTTSTGRVKPRKRHVWMDAYGEVHRGKPPAALKGGYEGKAGSIRRSRKGAMRRLANGSRKYIADWDNTVKFYTI